MNEVHEESRKVKKEYNNTVLKRKSKESQINHMKEQIRLFQEKRRNLTHGLDIFRKVI